jgi:outer membrane receptor for ferrienterochelin and colicins
MDPHMSHERLSSTLAPGLRGLSAALCLAPAFAHAQPAPAAAAATLDAVVVTASSRAQPLADVQAAVQVITQDDLRAYAGTSVTEALKLAVGVDARANGTSAFVALRGFIANAGNPVLLLVDGLRRTAKYGTANLNLLSVEDVERIEIVRGPMSALYGADATGGVINVITRAPQPGQAFGGHARVLYGSTDDGQRGTLVAAGTVYAGSAHTGHRVSVEKRSRGLFRYPGTPSSTSDLAKIDETFVSYEGTVRLAPQQQLRWLVEHADQDDTSPARTARAPVTDFLGYERERRTFGALRYAGALGPGVLSVDLGQGASKGSTTRSFPTIEMTDYDQTQLQARYALEAGAHSLVAGAGVNRDVLNVSIVSSVARTTGRHVLLQDEWRFAPSWTLLAGVRHDDFSTFGSATTPRLSLGWAPGPLHFRLGYGEAFRAPSPLEQHARFVRGRFLILGNPSIQPETNKSWEFATAWRSRTVSAEWVLFRSNVDNLIQTINAGAEAGDPAGVTTRTLYANVGKARLQGSELNGTWRVSDRWHLVGGWDWLDAKDALSGARLTQRARHTVRAGARWASGAWRVDLHARYLYDYWASAAVVAPTPAPPPSSSNFGTADVKLTYAFDRTWSVSFGIDNLFDRRQPSNYSATGSVQDPPGRFLHATAIHRF